VPMDAYMLVKMSRMNRALATGSAACRRPMINLRDDPNS
jgi:hypothetical protein